MNQLPIEMDVTSKNPKYYISKKCLMCNSEFVSLIKRNQKFCNVKCSSKYTALDKDRLAKIKKTKLKRYGSETYVNSDKARKTCIEKYGVDNFSKTEQCKELIKKSNLEKFGVEWSWQDENIKNKIKSTNLSKYGVENASSSEMIRKKIRDTTNVKYGVDNVFQNKLIKDKIYNTNINRYGNKIPVNSATIKSKMLMEVRRKNFHRIFQTSKINDYITPLFSENDYINTYRTNRYQFKCNLCSSAFEDHIDGGHIPRCLKCNPFICGFSLGEKEIVDYIRNILPNEEIIEKCRGLLNKGELDVYIPDRKIAIEYNGLYWHSELSGKKSKKYHLNKTNECLEKGIRLIHIFEDEWIYKKDIVKNKLDNIFKININDSVYARKCEISEISSSQCRDFLENNHIQGKCESSIKIGLFEGENIVAVMTFGKMRRSMGNKGFNTSEFEMYRYCTCKSVVGGASKLLSHFIKTYKPRRIVSYADRRWSNGNVYNKIGFDLVSHTPPNYFYIKPGTDVRYHRYNFSKHTLCKKVSNFREHLTEWENMQRNGYDRIWDCGHLKYELVLH